MTNLKLEGSMIFSVGLAQTDCLNLHYTPGLLESANVQSDWSTKVKKSNNSSVLSLSLDSHPNTQHGIRHILSKNFVGQTGLSK